jgi:hypothetical protein
MPCRAVSAAGALDVAQHVALGGALHPEVEVELTVSPPAKIASSPTSTRASSPRTVSRKYGASPTSSGRRSIVCGAVRG